MTEQAWTTRRLLGWLAGAFEQRGIDQPRRMAEELLAHVLGTERLRLYMDADRPASELERQSLRDLAKRALAHEPIQYLTGEESFYGLRFAVDRRVLIPRPSTQTLVGAVLEHVRTDLGGGSVRASDAGAGLLIGDIGTGSGAIAVALAVNLPGVRLVATDVSGEALEVARANAELNGVDDRIDFAAGDMLDALDVHPPARGAGRLDVLASNPPYIPDDEWAAVGANVKDHEPTGALRGGVDGMDFVRPLIEQGPERLRPGGLLAIEIAAARASDALTLAEEQGMLEGACVLRDCDGLERVLVAVRCD